MIVNKIGKMKNRMQYNLVKYSWVFLLLIVFISCKTTPEKWEPESENLVISQYLELNEQYSEFFGLLEETRLNRLLAVRGPFTLFLPDNDAMSVFYTEKGISSYLDLTSQQQFDLAMNHIIDAEINASGIGLGALIEVNGIGDYLVSEFEGSDIIINKNSKILDQDILAANGVIHQVSKVLDPVTKTIYQILKENQSYSIFTEGLELAGLNDTLSIIDFPYGKTTARARYTILAVADTTFQRFGINSIDDLVAKYSDSGNLKDMNNGFYRYMEYHCLAEIRYLSDLELGANNYPVLSYDNYVSITVDDDYKINVDNKSKKYTAFNISQSNTPGKNGTIHSINGLLPVIQPVARSFKWETTNHFDLKQLDCYGKTYGRFFDGQNDFENIKWEGSYMLYYYKETNNAVDNYDMLSMSGWWWCEVTTPKIMKGKYNLTSNLWSGWVSYAVYVDGVNTASINITDPANSTSWGEFDWTTTESHKIKVVAKTPGILFWDLLTFTPIN